MSFPQIEEDVKELERGQKLMIKLQSLVDKGNWPDVDLKAYAQLLCEDILRIFEACVARPERVAGDKPQLDDDRRETERTPYSALNPAKFKRSVEKKPRLDNHQHEKLTSRTVETKERTKHAHGLDWRKYGTKPIKNQRYSRDYYRCKDWHKGCPATKQVMQIDSDDDPPKFDVIYVNQHTCEKRISTHSDRLNIPSETCSKEPTCSRSFEAGDELITCNKTQQPRHQHEHATIVSNATVSEQEGGCITEAMLGASRGENDPSSSTTHFLPNSSSTTSRLNAVELFSNTDFQSPDHDWAQEYITRFYQ